MVLNINVLSLLSLSHISYRLKVQWQFNEFNELKRQLGFRFRFPKDIFILVYYYIFFKVFVYFHKYYLFNTGLILIICNSYNLKAYNTILRNAHYNHCWTIHLYNNKYGLAETCLVSNQIVRLWSLKAKCFYWFHKY